MTHRSKGHVVSISLVLFISRQARTQKIDNWGGGGGHIFIYSYYVQLISFEIEIKILKSIVFTVCRGGGGGHIFIYSCSQTVKTIDFKILISISKEIN